MKSTQRGFIGIIALLVTVLIIGIWFAMDAKSMFGTGENGGASSTPPVNDWVAPSATDESAIQKAKDVNKQVEEGYENLQ